MKTILRTISYMMVSHIYKWILPIAVTILMLFFADKDRNLLIRFLLWLFTCIAYISIPLNFEHPKREAFAYFLEQSIIATIVITILAFALSIGVFIITALSIIMYFPQIAEFGLLFGIINSLLYLGSIVLEYWLLPDKLQTQS